jgi:hypothetical protein
MEGKVRGLVEELSTRLPGKTEKKYKIPQSKHPVPRQRFESNHLPNAVVGLKLKLNSMV